jgi:protein-S-isoprenylcysteine O-methyltransferase Ste14
VRVGGWLFRYRTSIPLPIVAALLLIPPQRLSRPFIFDALGAALVALGEATRLWAVRHIGVISRTRSERLGPLVASGPFALVRNPLYLGNIAMWAGFALSAGMVWLVPVVLLFLVFVYHAIVRWEESLLEARRGDEYLEYARRVPRWVPRFSSPAAASGPLFSWSDTLFSERGTLIGIVAGYLLLYLKSRVNG